MHFTFDGVDSRNYGIYMRDPLPIFAAEEDTEYYDVPGREGSLTVKKGGHNDLETEMACYIKDISEISKALAFMQGSGRLVQSVEPDRRLNVTFTGVPRADRLVKGLDAWEMEVPVRIKPFRYFYPEPEGMTITSSGTMIENPGTYKSAPRIRIEGNGDIVLTVGMNTMAFTGIENGLIIDSEEMNCYELDGVTRIYNDEQIDIEEFPKINPGTSFVTWTGSVSRIVITPRWRDR